MNQHFHTEPESVLKMGLNTEDLIVKSPVLNISFKILFLCLTSLFPLFFSGRRRRRLKIFSKNFPVVPLWSFYSFGEQNVLFRVGGVLYLKRRKEKKKGLSPFVRLFDVFRCGISLFEQRDGRDSRLRKSPLSFFSFYKDMQNIKDKNVAFCTSSCVDLMYHQ